MEEGQKKPKLFIIGVIAGVLILIIMGGVVVLRGSSSNKPPQTSSTSIPEDVFPTADPSIEVSLALSSDGHSIILEVKHIPSDITSLEYEIGYETGSGLLKGALTDRPVELKPNQGEYTKEITLGTCSRGKCVYDEGVRQVSVVLRFNGSKGTSVFQKDFSL